MKELNRFGREMRVQLLNAELARSSNPRSIIASYWFDSNISTIVLNAPKVWLATDLERIWHVYNHGNDKLIHPLGERELADVIQLYRHKQLWAFRIQYRGHIAGVRANDPDLRSEIMDAP